MEWNWPTWFLSVAAVAISGALAWFEGHWSRRPGLAMGFANHGGMWSDLVLLPFANAVIVPHLNAGVWIASAIAIGGLASVLLHVHWYGAGRPLDRHDREDGDHMWPRRAGRTWSADLSWSWWAHVFYVTGELVMILCFLVHPMPVDVVLLVAIIFTIHVPIGLLQPRYFLSGHIATMREQPLLLPSLVALWSVVALKWP